MPKRVRKYLQKLKKDFPLRKKVRVRTFENLVDEDGKSMLYGVTWNCDDSFLIWLNRSLHEETVIDILFHEWAHCLMWSRWPRSHSKHSTAFWKIYGEIYRRYVDS